MTEKCKHGNYCVRMIGHAGCHTAAPSAATLDWDHDRKVVETQHIDTAVTLLMLDFETPWYADLRDEDE